MVDREKVARVASRYPAHLRSASAAVLATLGILLAAPVASSEIVTPTSVLTTSQWSGFPDGEKENMIDGSGLSGAGPVASQRHDADPNAGTMWVVGPSDGGLGGPVGNPPVVAEQAVVFDLGAPTALNGVYIWNNNQANLTGRGVDGFEILVSSDADPSSATFTSVGSFTLSEACGCSDEVAQFVEFAATTVRLVKFDIATCHSGATNDYVGLSEVRFWGWRDNLDPDDVGAHYAWGEHIGWVNAKPQGQGGPGMVVHDDGLMGWIWAENAGWISLSCQNTSSCGTTDYGVLNDGSGVLNGYAWGEHLGWVNFGKGSPDFGVRIDTATGLFSGLAWAEHHGWINFGSAQTPQPTQIVTGGCAALNVEGRFGQVVLATNATEHSWPLTVAWQLAKGTFSTSADIGTYTTDFFTVGAGTGWTDPTSDPEPGHGYWYLYRPNCPIGSYSSGNQSERGNRDEALIP